MENEWKMRLRNLHLEHEREAEADGCAVASRGPFGEQDWSSRTTLADPQEQHRPELSLMRRLRLVFVTMFAK